MGNRPTDLERDGAVLIAGALDCETSTALLGGLAAVPMDRPGARLRGVAGLADVLAADGAIGRLAAQTQGAGARPVRAVLFDKTAENNWSLGWHQDRTIVVGTRIETDGFGPWSTKAGLQHVAPPFALLEQMLTLRVHLDDVGPANAPLLVALGSHQLGRIPADEIEASICNLPRHACVAMAGDVWVYATPIVHASERAAEPKRRRVLQVDYAAFDLPNGLTWLGV